MLHERPVKQLWKALRGFCKRATYEWAAKYIEDADEGIKTGAYPIMLPNGQHKPNIGKATA